MRLLSAIHLTLYLTFILALSQSARGGLIRDTELEAGLQELAAPLLKAANLAPKSIDFRIIINSNYNAFVAGEKVVYLNSGLILNSQSPEEILGVIAHELGHITAGHVPRRDETVKDASKAGTLAALAAIALAAGGVSNNAAMGVAIGGTDQAKRNMLRSFRYDEAIADELGLEYLDKAGITSAGLEQMMRRMAAQRALPESRQSQYYTTHPGAARRLAIYLDHTKQTRHRTSALSITKQRLANRLIKKLRAYSEPADTVLQQTDAADQANTNYSHAIAHYRRGDLSAAYKLMTELSNKAPDDAFYHEFRGDILMSMADPELAVLVYKKALKLRPNSPQIQLNLGRALIATNEKANIRLAIRFISSAKASEPKWAFIHRQLAIAYGRVGQIARADLSLAEEAILLGDEQQALRLAKRILAMASIADDIKNRANDILYRFGSSSK